MKKNVVVKYGFEMNDLYEVSFVNITPIIVMIKEAREKILNLEINNPKGLLDPELVNKISDIKYQLGHALTKEKI